MKRREFLFAPVAAAALVVPASAPKGREHLVKETAREWAAIKGKHYCINCDAIHDVEVPCKPYVPITNR